MLFGQRFVCDDVSLSVRETDAAGEREMRGSAEALFPFAITHSSRALSGHSDEIKK